jgi:F-type H+-transporting ATPase subunit epsilon
MYHLQILTPEEVVYDDNVISLIAPGALGYLGVLRDHAPLVTTLKDGVLIITPQNKQKLFYKISGGLLEVRHNEAYLLTQKLEPTDPIDMESGI